MLDTRYFIAATTHRYPETWQRCKEVRSWGATHRLRAMERVQPGDKLLVWLGRKGFAATASATGTLRQARPDEMTFWEEQGKSFPYRFSLEPVKDYGTPLPLDFNTEPEGTFGITRMQLWPGFFEITGEQYERIVGRLEESNSGVVSAPHSAPHAVAEPSAALEDADIAPPDPTELQEERKHNLAQLRLLQIGKAVTGQVLPANNDRNREVSGIKFTDISMDGLTTSGLSPDAARTIKNIDVLWVNEGEVVAAFEIEMSTSIYSGLLRMADLVAAHPYSHIALYIVADEEKRQQVFRELRRPTFTKLGMTARTKFLAYDRLDKLLSLATDLRGSLKPNFIDQQAESVPE